jgi:hypothetical protein
MKVNEIQGGTTCCRDLGLIHNYFYHQHACRPNSCHFFFNSPTPSLGPEANPYFFGGEQMSVPILFLLYHCNKTKSVISVKVPYQFMNKSTGE